MELKKILQDAVNYIEEHLLEDISYEDVAKKVYMSSYNFHRTFSMVAGTTANTYIRNRRLALAGHELQTTDISVIGAAYKYGYETPESFSKAFSRFHNVTPSQAKKKGIQLSMFNPLVIKIIIEGGNMMDYRIEKKNKQKFIAKVREFDNESGDAVDKNGCSIPEFWGETNAAKSVELIRNLRPEGKRDLYGLCTSIDKDSSKFNYGIGVVIDSDTEEADIDNIQSKGFSLWKTEPFEYVVFKCYGDNGDCIGEMWSKFYKEFLPNTKYEMADGTDYEIYYEKGTEGMFCELWIPIC